MLGARAGCNPGCARPHTCEPQAPPSPCVANLSTLELLRARWRLCSSWRWLMALALALHGAGACALRGILKPSHHLDPVEPLHLIASHEELPAHRFLSALACWASNTLLSWTTLLWTMLCTMLLCTMLWVGHWDHYGWTTMGGRGHSSS